MGVGGLGLDFQKIFFEIFFDQIDFPSSLKELKRPCFGQTFYAAGTISKNRPQNRVFRHFLENFDHQNCVFLARAPPQSKYILAPKAPLENF